DVAAVRLPHGITERATPVGSAKDGATHVRYSAHRLAREAHHFVVAKQPGVATHDAEHVPAAVDCAEDRGTDNRVQAGSVPAPGGYGNAHRHGPGVRFSLLKGCYRGMGAPVKSATRRMSESCAATV